MSVPLGPIVKLLELLVPNVPWPWALVVLAAVSVPPLIVTLPVKVLGPVSVNGPANRVRLPAAADHAGIGPCIVEVIDQRSVIYDARAGHRPVESARAIAHLQCAGGDRCDARVSIRCRKQQDAAAELGQAACAIAEDAGDGGWRRCR